MHRHRRAAAPGEMKQVPDVIKVYRHTEVLQNGKFVASIQIHSRSGISPIRDNDTLFRTRQEAWTRERELAEKWKLDHAPNDAVLIFCN